MNEKDVQAVVHQTMIQLQGEIDWWKARFRALCGPTIYEKALLERAEYAMKELRKAAGQAPGPG